MRHFLFAALASLILVPKAQAADLSATVLTAGKPFVNGFFGLSVGISGTIAIAIAIVGASGSDHGAAYLFDTTTGKQTVKLTPTDSVKGDGFGLSVSISGTTGHCWGPFKR
ncbi:hypothetical protein [Falsihalocynthiibacter arcticus]|uniref:hypothetical protein n=1 Tax=Falsihalocynthiibacter arcticus TaxID=1579316 RepID=UPI003002FE9D